ncbi:hypothetical protein SAMN05444354_1189 [Stigmatella aurantiaca]|uniref:Uncharacterized protein n=1 Tax=Stigmatella aurantiaca TaxID=41 RepID=A0A1H7Z1Z9_STIAU|nr:hypothetical protein [Stigmatella aurantiaca]SEM51547.1 hypothetical protein SAMN05444354_1189 [Stigmatella aurantiaca]
MLQFKRSKQFLRVSCSALLLAGACAPVDSAPDGQDDVTETATSPLLFSGVSFKTVLGGRYVGAQNNGGGAVTATATAAQAWEKFTIDDINGGSLVSGDTVFITAGTGQYFQAANGGGSTLNAASWNRQGWETFRIVRKNGSGTIVNGDIVGLQTVTTGHWVSAENGGGSTVFAYGAALDSWEQFTISGLSGGTTPPPTGTGCDAPGLVWKTANKTNYTSYPDPGSEECTEYNGCTWAGQFAACSGKKPESWVAAHNIAAVFPNMNAYKLHDLCLKSGSKTIVVTVLDTCADSDCSGCCTRNKGDADALIDLESYTNARWGVPDGRIQWADLGPTKGSGCN